MLVTQGTIAADPRNLVLPAIRGLADTGALVVATTVGLDPDDVLPPVEPAAHPFVPFTELLPLVDVMVTNGGAGRSGDGEGPGRPAFRARAEELRGAYAGYTGAARTAESILEVARVRTPVG